MKVLGLCCFTNFWPESWSVENWDLKLGRNVLDLPDNYGKTFDLVACAPPCTQFTKANSHHWRESPAEYVEIAKKCFDIAINSNLWFLENPPGRIETFIPELKNFRVCSWKSPTHNKEYILYGNFLIFQPWVKRYGKLKIPENKSKVDRSRREAWDPALIKDIVNSLKNLNPKTV